MKSTIQSWSLGHSMDALPPTFNGDRDKFQIWVWSSIEEPRMTGILMTGAIRTCQQSHLNKH
eukprot:4569537-Amphidinium_carterae.1